MNYFTKKQMILTALLSLVLAFGFASPAYAYTDQEIVDYINNNLQGMSDAEIAAVAESFGVSATDISNAYADVSGGTVDVSARAEEAYSQVITVNVNGTDYYTTGGDLANVYTSATAGQSIGTFDASTGTYTDTGGGSVNITTLSNVTGSVTNESGTVTIQISDQEWQAVLDTYAAASAYSACTASGSTGCLETYLASGANVSIANLTPAGRLACLPAAAPSSVSCSTYAGSTLGAVSSIPSNYTLGNVTYSIDSCGILTNVDVSGCQPPIAAITSFTVSPEGLPPGGGRVELEWESVYTTSCRASGGWSGDKPTSGRESVTVTRETTSFNLTCVGPDGTTVSTSP